MSHIPGGGHILDTPITKDPVEARKAALKICDLADGDRDVARRLLQMLGMLPNDPDPEETQMCSKGIHPMTPENTIYRADGGYLRCRDCVNKTTRDMRARAGKKNRVLPTHCGRGHEFTPENTRLTKNGRRCMACHDLASKENWKKKRAEGLALACGNGHPWTPESTYIRRDGRRQCNTCINNRYRRKQK